MRFVARFISRIADCACRIAAASLLSASLPWIASAATTTWTGAAGGGSGRWEIPANWSDGAPAQDGTTSVVLAGVTNTNTTFTTPQSILGLTYDATAANFRIASAQTLTIGANGISSNNAQAHILAAPIALAAAQQWNSGAGRLRLQKDLSGAVDLTKSGTGTLEIESTATTSNFTGSLLIDDGTVEFGPDDFTNAQLVALDGGTFKAAAGNTVAAPFAVPILVTAGESAIDTNGFDLSVSKITSTSAFTGGTFYKRGAGALTVTDEFTFVNAAYSVDAGSLLTSGAVKAGSSQPRFHVAEGAAVDLGGASVLSLSRLEGGGEVSGFSDLHVTVSGDEAENVFSGNLSGSGLVLRGTLGRHRLSGDNSGLTDELTVFINTTVGVNSDKALGAPNTTLKLGGRLRADAPFTINAQRSIQLSSSVALGHIDTNGHDVEFAGSFINPEGIGALTKHGAGTLKLSGNNDGLGINYYVRGGVLEAISPKVLGKGSVNLYTAGTLRLTSAGEQTFDNHLSAGGTIDVSNPLGDVTLTHRITSSIEGLVKDGPGTLRLDASGIVLGVIVKGGTLRGSSAELSSPLEVRAAGTVRFEQPVAGAVAAKLTGAGTVVLDAPGTWNLTGDSSGFAGTVSVLGTSTIQLDAPLGALGGTLELDALARLQANANVNLAVIGGSPATRIIAGADVSLGNAASFTGFSTAGSLSIGSHSVTLRSAGLAGLGASTTISGGTLTAAKGVALGSGEVIKGTGGVAGRVAADLGSTITATGALRLGDVNSAAGFRTAGDLDVGAHSVTLEDANEAVLGALTTLDGGVLRARQSASASDAAPHFLVNAGDNITGRGQIHGNFKNNGNAIGAGFSEDDRLVFAAPWKVTGKGTFSSTLVLGTFAPGESPGVVNGDDMAFGGTIEFELGGLTPGSSNNNHDQINDAGTLSLFGDVDLRVLPFNGFVPNIGDAFTVMTWTDGLNGAFDDILVDPFYTSRGLTFSLNVGSSTGTGSAVLTVVAVPEPGALALFCSAAMSAAALRVRLRSR